MIRKDIGYNYNDLTIVPKILSSVESRSECNPFYLNGYLPIFTAPMSTIVNEENIKTWWRNNINPIVPRNISIKKRLNLLHEGFWTAFSLREFEEIFVNNTWDAYLKSSYMYKVCIDIANGHMEKLYKLCTKAKNLSEEHNYKLSIMTGNIANPNTYRYLCSLHSQKGNLLIDYIRVSIGSGAGCLTSSNVGVHYPIASLIDECNEIKVYYKEQFGENTTKIIADGGIRNYSDVIKALALGADYVMIGGLFAGIYESASPLLNVLHEEAYIGKTEEDKRKQLNSECYFKEFYGMSTKKAQKLLGKSNKTSEGKYTYVPVKYTLQQWTENMIDYLKSAMSYCNAKTLEQFIGNQNLIINSIGEQSSVNK